MPPSDGGSMVQELLDLFTEGAPKAHFRNQELEKRPEKLAFAAHALKSMSVHLGARRLSALAEQLEHAGRTGNLAGVPELLRDLDVAYTRTRVRLLAYSEEYPNAPASNS